jgi:hypothetical protein
VAAEGLGVLLRPLLQNVCAHVKRRHAEAKWNAKYLSILRAPFATIAKVDRALDDRDDAERSELGADDDGERVVDALRAVHRCIPAMVKTLRMIWASSRYYSKVDQWRNCCLASRRRWRSVRGMRASRPCCSLAGAVGRRALPAGKASSPTKASMKATARAPTKEKTAAARARAPACSCARWPRQSWPSTSWTAGTNASPASNASACT